jgi:toxin ParE1/3/4
MDYQVVLSPSARSDLRDIVRYISFDAPDRALQFGLFLISRTRFLAQSPELGRVVPEFEEQSIREIVVRSYRIVYRLDDRPRSVEVIRFWHAARGIPEIDA